MWYIALLTFTITFVFFFFFHQMTDFCKTFLFFKLLFVNFMTFLFYFLSLQLFFLIYDICVLKLKNKLSDGNFYNWFSFCVHFFLWIVNNSCFINAKKKHKKHFPNNLYFFIEKPLKFEWISSLLYKC